jgi:hypothetical protein
MKTEKLKGGELDLLMHEKGGICVSIIVPTHRLSPERSVDKLQVEKAISKATEYLLFKYPKDEVSPILKSLDELFLEMDFNHNCEGIGLFASMNLKKSIPFHFPVKERVIVTDTFEIRDILYQDYYADPYLLLLLDEKEAKLYKGKYNKVEEVKDDIFPYTYTEEYEYSKPSRGTSYVGHTYVKEFERDKSQLEEIRTEQFFGKIDKQLGKYLLNIKSLIVAGVKKDLTEFKSVTKHTIVSEITGNQTYSSINEIGDRAWKAVKAFINKRKEEMIREVEEKIGQGFAITGIYEIWKAVKEGRGLRLLTEKDYSLPGFLEKGDDYNLYLHVPTVDHKIIPDVINYLMEQILRKNGEVVLFENNKLAKLQRLALVTRY